MNLLDKTEALRRVIQHAANHIETENIPGQTWDTAQLQEDFNVEGFLAPYVVVVRKRDNVRGTMMFRHNPRIYWAWNAD